MSLTTAPIANPAVRIVNGEELPATGTYALDPSHSEVGFAVRHVMVAKTRGRFSDFAGTVEIGENPLESSVEVTIQTASIDTRDEQRDGHLRSGDFFDVEHHPTITFKSTGVTVLAQDRYRMAGDFTIKGVTRPVELDLVYLGSCVDPYNQLRVGFEGAGSLQRSDWGLTWNVVLEAGGLVVSDRIDLEFDLSAIKEGGSQS